MPSNTAKIPETIIIAPANTASPEAHGDTRCRALPADRPSVLMRRLLVREMVRPLASATGGPSTPPVTGDPHRSQTRSPMITRECPAVARCRRGKGRRRGPEEDGHHERSQPDAERHAGAQIRDQ